MLSNEELSYLNRFGEIELKKLIKNRHLIIHETKNYTESVQEEYIILKKIMYIASSGFGSANNGIGFAASSSEPIYKFMLHNTRTNKDSIKVVDELTYYKYEEQEHIKFKNDTYLVFKEAKLDVDRMLEDDDVAAIQTKIKDSRIDWILVSIIFAGLAVAITIGFIFCCK